MYQGCTKLIIYTLKIASFLLKTYPVIKKGHEPNFLVIETQN